VHTPPRPTKWVRLTYFHQQSPGGAPLYCIMMRINNTLYRSAT